MMIPVRIDERTGLLNAGHGRVEALKQMAEDGPDAPSGVTVVEGAWTVTTNARPTPSTMPAFGWKLGDDQVAAVATYVRNAWGNSGPQVTADQVKAIRRELHGGNISSSADRQ